MSESQQPSPEGLIPAGGNALVTRSSGLVTRGLELIRDGKLKKREIRLLIGDLSNNITSIPKLVEDALSSERKVVVTQTHEVLRLVESSRRMQFDLCVVVLNNLHGLPGRESADGMAAFVTTLKEACRCPVIALAGWPDDVSLGEKVMRAGASAFFRLPFPGPEFIEAVKMCLPPELGGFKKRKILALDDENVLLEVIRLIFENLGYEVVRLKDKAEALARFGEIKPDLIITDLVSPGLGGFDFIRLVKELDPSIPVIVTSGTLNANYDINGERARKALQLGAFACLGKPFDVSRLVQIIETAMEVRHQ